jgi:hypothetical protein
MLLRNEEHTVLCGLSVRPENYQEPRQFAEDYQVVGLLRKSLNIPGQTEESRKAKALDKFLVAEAHNAETNARLSEATLPDWFGEFSSNVLRVLGPLDTEALDEIASLGKFGPGAAVGVRSEGLVPSIKYDAKPVSTSDLAPYLPGLMPWMVTDYWGENLREKSGVVEGNRHFTVRKDWDIDRCAATEPLWNSFLQAGIGRKMVRRLMKFGVDLHDQRLNQALASMAELWGLSTVDLTSASDMMCRELVWLALCYNGTTVGKRWFHLLDTARSKSMKIGKDFRRLEMFSSMGNGFTFPLETIIFLAVIMTVVPWQDRCLATTYGDDIVVPQRSVHRVVECLEYLGFQVNGKKTCLAGTFFESCGTDWFQGHEVRPFFLRKEDDSAAPYALQAANMLRAWCIKTYGELPARYKSLWGWCKGLIPRDWRVLVSPEVGDVGLHVGRDEAIRKGAAYPCPVAKPDVEEQYSGWEGYVTRKLVKVRPVLTDRRSFGVLCVGLSQPSLQAVGIRLFGSHTDTASCGREAIRGLYGKLTHEVGVVLWEDNFNWL